MLYTSLFVWSGHSKPLSLCCLRNLLGVFNVALYSVHVSRKGVDRHSNYLGTDMQLIQSNLNNTIKYKQVFLSMLVLI